jgi:hypothetical protein
LIIAERVEDIVFSDNMKPSFRALLEQCVDENAKLLPSSNGLQTVYTATEPSRAAVSERPGKKRKAAPLPHVDETRERVRACRLSVV